MNISKNHVVTLHYRLSDGSGTEIESSFGDQPMSYIHGMNNIIPGLEQALANHKVGDELEVTVLPEDGYGPYLQELVQQVPTEAFGDAEKIEPGMRFIAETDVGQKTVVVTAVEDGQVTVDGNHPLAGHTLNFFISIESIREASEEELSHGHVHAEGGCNHDHSDESHQCGHSDEKSEGEHQCCGKCH